MSETNEAIASLRSSIDVLHAIVAGIQAQVCTKVDTTALAALNSRVTACEGKIPELGTPVAAQGRAVTGLTSTITREASAREDADDALCTHIGALSCNLQDNRAAARATSTLATRVTSAEEPTLEVDPGKAIEPLHMGKVTFYGESARAIRDAQEVLRAAGAGQLEVVKRESQGDSPFFVVDGQAFITAATIKDSAIDPASFKVKTDKVRIDHAVIGGYRVNLAVNEQGQYVAVGLGIGIQDAEQPKAFSADDLLNQIRAQISESKLGTELADRVALIEQSVGKQGGENGAVHDRLVAIELGLTAQKGINDAARVRIDQRIDALQAQVDNLQGKVYG
ncbi:hypothetical protein [Pseudomonas asiatica]|uniref:hypothetical protein n=1 Tax=Pseudomonas asiatica TaxID=2219225 RepID=UPI0023652711|nr:hypothetical protein [Pseudomonas asiatica]MDD1981364.1 hypothetical protein [Pseudomonas asiatica]